MAKTRKHTLALDDDPLFDMIGICSHHSDYRLVWGINETLRLHLRKCEEDYIVTAKKGETISTHSMYEFQDDENRLEYYLIKNKHYGKFLIPEKPTIDYFLFLCNNCAIDPDELMMELKQVESVLAVYPFDPDEVDSAHHIIF